jgi:signal transduction histidine kinase
MYGQRITSSLPGRKKLLLLLLIIFVPALVIIVLSGMNERNEDTLKARNNTLLVIQSLAAQQEQVAIATKQMLSTLALLPEVQRLDANACSEIFRELQNLNPSYYVIHAETPDGNVFVASAPFPPDSVNLSDRKHIKDAIRTLDFSAGEYIVSRVVTVPSINYAYPVLDSNRNLVAILTAGFKLDEYARFISNANLTEAYSIVITDHKGVRLYRWPDNEAIGPGITLSSDSFERISGDSDHGIFEKIGRDGINRVYAFRQLRLNENSSPYLYIIASVAKDKILQKATLKMFRNLSFLGVAALLAVFLAWCFGNVSCIKPTNRFADAAQCLGKGEMGTRTGLPYTPDELGRLAKSFDEMASLLELRNIERQNAEEALSKAYSESEIRVQMLTAELETTNNALEEAVARANDLAEQVRLASTAGNVLLAGMSHELRSPFMVIIGFTELILDKQFGDLTPKQEEYLGDVAHSARELFLLINDILDLTKIEAGKLQLELSEVRLPELLSRSLTFLKEKASKHNIQLSYEEKEIPASIIADERKLKQILYKLLSNAVKFTPDGGKVRLRSEFSDGFVQVSIEDSGIGIKKEDLQRIFDPFEQADNSPSRRFEGTGLGLSLTRRMVELHGGKIWAESEGEEKGTRFFFLLPTTPPNMNVEKNEWQRN